MDVAALDGFAAAIDRDAEVPIGLQLGWALCARIHEGEFRPGQRLPGLRELAEASGLNVNTVRAVYQRLEQRGLLESQQGSGTFVASTLPRASAVGAIAADAAREAQATGVDPREVAAALYVAMPQHPPAAPAASARGAEPAGGAAGDSAAHRRALRAQIATLERAIGEIEAEHPGVAPRPTATRRGPGPTLLSAEELERVRSGLVHRLATVQLAIDERAASEAADGSAAIAKNVARARAGARARARARVSAEKDTSTPDPHHHHHHPDPSSSPATAPARPSRPRSAPRPAAAGT
jgi:DNA-binding transcriptional regulator YhcF (GntR family)